MKFFSLKSSLLLGVLYNLSSVNAQNASTCQCVDRPGLVETVVGVMVGDVFDCEIVTPTAQVSMDIQLKEDTDVTSDLTVDETSRLETIFVSSYNFQASRVCDPLVRTVSDTDTKLVNITKDEVNRLWTLTFDIPTTCTNGCNAASSLFWYDGFPYETNNTLVERCGCFANSPNHAVSFTTFWRIFDFFVILTPALDRFQNIVHLEEIPGMLPTSSPIISVSPSKTPTKSPTSGPSPQPSFRPSANPTKNPTSGPSPQPSFRPSANPTKNPTSGPSPLPSRRPTISPSANPTGEPTREPLPTQVPSRFPTWSPTVSPTMSPIDPTEDPTASPTYCLEARCVEYGDNFDNNDNLMFTFTGEDDRDRLERCRQDTDIDFFWQFQLDRRSDVIIQLPCCHTGQVWITKGCDFCDYEYFDFGIEIDEDTDIQYGANCTYFETVEIDKEEVIIEYRGQHRYVQFEIDDRNEQYYVELDSFPRVGEIGFCEEYTESPTMAPQVPTIPVVPNPPPV